MPNTRKHFMCTIAGCKGKHKAQGLCSSHYDKQRFKVHGSRPYNAAVADKYHRSVGGQFKSLRDGAKKRGLEVSITKIDFKLLRLQTCYYCGGPLPPKGHGIDRLDNSLGYLKDNVVPCCYPCNRTKSDMLSPEEMRIIIEHRNMSVIAERMISAC